MSVVFIYLFILPKGGGLLFTVIATLNREQIETNEILKRYFFLLFYGSAFPHSKK